MMWPSKTLAVVVFILQIAQSPSCTFTKICQDYSSYFEEVYINASTTLYDCLKACYSIKNCAYAAFDSGRCWGGVNLSFKEGVNPDFCYYYRLERESIADPKQCRPVSDLL